MKKLFKILLLLLLAGILIFINSFFGNPISKLIVKNNANQYINKNYSKLELEVDSVIYDFKFGDYKVNVQSKKSIDTNFDMHFDKLGRFKFDEREYILKNTYDRFETELLNYGKSIEKIEKKNYEIRLYPLNGEKYENRLKLDQKVDFNNFPFSVGATASEYVKEPSYEEAFKILKDIDSIMETKPINVKVYSIHLILEKNKDKDKKNIARSYDEDFMIDNIPVEVIKNGSISDLKKLKK